MRNLLLIFTLLFSTVVFSSSSYAGWTKVGKTVEGNTHYVDFERIRKVDGYVYYWIDCKLFRDMELSFSFHKEPMGGGTGEVHNVPDKEWRYPPPNSVAETILKAVCSR